MTNPSNESRRPSDGSARSHNTNTQPPPLPSPHSTPTQPNYHHSHHGHQGNQQPPPLPPTMASQAAIENWHVYRAATDPTNAFAKNNPATATHDDPYDDAPTPAETVVYSPPGTPINYTAIDTDDEDVRIAVTALGSMRALSGSNSSLHQQQQHQQQQQQHGYSHNAGAGAVVPMSLGSAGSRRPSIRDRALSTSSAGHSNPNSHSSGSHTQHQHSGGTNSSSGKRDRTISQHSGSSGGGKQILLGGLPSGISAGASSRSTILGHMPPPPGPSSIGPSSMGPSSMSSSASYMAPSSRVSSHFSSSSTMSSAFSTPMSTPATEHTYLSGSGPNAPSLLTADGPAPYRPLRPQASAGDLPFRSGSGSSGEIKMKGKGRESPASSGGRVERITLPPPSSFAKPPSSPMCSSFGSASTALYSGPLPPVSQSRRRNTSAISRMSSTSALTSSTSKPGIPSIVRPLEDTDMMPPPASTTVSSSSASRSSISKAASMASLRMKKGEEGVPSMMDVARRGGGAADAFGQTKGSGLRSMLVEAGVAAGGLSAAMSNESMKSLKYCLHWLQYATARIEHQITILRDTMVKLNHGELDLNSPAVQNLTMIKGDVVTTIKGVVDVIGKYAGIALPEQARRSVKGFVLSLPARWASVNRIQTPVAVPVGGAGVRRSSFGGSPASPSFGAQFAQGQDGSSGSGSRGASAAFSSTESALQIHETSQAANRIITLAVESLDILRNVTIVFGESLDRADVWVERLRAVGLRRKRMHEQQELDEAESAEAYMLQDQQWYPASGAAGRAQQQQQQQQQYLDSSVGSGSGSYRGNSPSPPPGSVQSGRQLAPSPSYDTSTSSMQHDTQSPARSAVHWELARGAAMVARASSPSAESVVSMATTASSSKRRRTIGSANGGAIVPNRNRSSHSPGDVEEYERGSGAGSSQSQSASLGGARGERLNLSMTPTVRTPAGSDDEGGPGGGGGSSSMRGVAAYPSNAGGLGYRSSRSSISYAGLSSPPYAGKVSPVPVYNQHQHQHQQQQQPSNLGGAQPGGFQFKARSNSIHVGAHHHPNASTPAHRRVGITTKGVGGSGGQGGSGSGSGSGSGGRSKRNGGRSGGNTPASYPQALYPE
ncbi:unnamed protein product [Tilletia controversa]|nr:hypothetical protein CF328_g4222 [Tilletia controversa]CAD6920271.1 unnamed protein product [Tilletia controversa]